MTDIVDRLYRLDADHRGVIDAFREAAREIERLRGDSLADRTEAADEIERLRKLVGAIERDLEKALAALDHHLKLNR